MSEATTARADASWVAGLWLVIALSTMVRLVVAGTTGLGIDESYAVTVARPLSWSYFDHPPLHFWMAGAMTWLSGDTRAMVVRLPFVLAFSATLWAVGRLGHLAFGARAGTLGALALACTGVLGLTTGTWVLPDGPLVLCAALAALVLAPMLFDDHTVAHASRGRWMLAGALLGGAMLAKYHGALYGAGLLLFLLTTAAGRQQLRTPGPWLAAAIALACTTPVLWWNAQHGWVSFRFQGARAATTTAWSIAPFLENVSGQALWLLPWMAIPFALALGRAVVRRRTDQRGWFFVCLALLPVGLFTVATLGGARGLPHWQAPGWLFVAPLVGRALDHALARGASWPRAWIPVAAGVWVALVAILTLQVATGWLGGQVAALRAPVDPTLDAFDWRALRDSLTARGIDIAGGVTARSWIQAGKLGVALGATTPIVCACDDPHHLSYREAPAGYPAILVEHAQPWKRGWRPASVALSDRLGPLDSLGAITLARAGQPAVTLVVYRRYGAALVTQAVYHRSRSISAPAANRAAANAF
jgi:4-amino-4-deoxy-L-arabinose transferase-like glycosyltransferase